MQQLGGRLYGAGRGSRNTATQARVRKYLEVPPRQRRGVREASRTPCTRSHWRATRTTDSIQSCSMACWSARLSPLDVASTVASMRGARLVLVSWTRRRREASASSSGFLCARARHRRRELQVQSASRGRVRCRSSAPRRALIDAVAGRVD